MPVVFEILLDDVQLINRRGGNDPWKRVALHQK